MTDVLHIILTFFLLYFSQQRKRPHVDHDYVKYDDDDDSISSTCQINQKDPESLSNGLPEKESIVLDKAIDFFEGSEGISSQTSPAGLKEKDPQHTYKEKDIDVTAHPSLAINAGPPIYNYIALIKQDMIKWKTYLVSSKLNGLGDNKSLGKLKVLGNVFIFLSGSF